MKQRDAAATIRAWRSFSGGGAAVRAFAAARLANMPLAALDDELRGLSGRVLSLGCGFGIVERYIAEVNADVEIDGLDLDVERIAAATATQDAAPRVRVHEHDIRAIAGDGGYDAAIAFDVMHHVAMSDHAAIAAGVRSALRPGGVLLVKDIATTPRWRHRFNQWHDRLVTGEFSVDARAPEDMAAIFEAEGFERRASRRIGPFSPYPHYLLTLAAPPAASSTKNGSSGTR